MVKGRNTRRTKVKSNLHDLIKSVQECTAYEEFYGEELISIARKLDHDKVIQDMIVEWFKRAMKVEELVNFRKERKWTLNDFDKDERRARRVIMKEVSNECEIKPEDVLNFWGNFLDDQDVQKSKLPDAWKEGNMGTELMVPVSGYEVEDAEWREITAAGPDNVSIKKWMDTPRSVRALFYSLILLSGSFPVEMLALHLKFFAKKNSKRPEQFEPISIASAAFRQMSRILKYRLYDANILQHPDTIQIDNLFVTFHVIKHAVHAKKPLYIAVLNFKKSSEGVFHDMVFESLADSGASQDFVEFLKNTFDGRFVLTGNRNAKPFSTRRGVLQGDPLSEPLLAHVFQYVSKHVKSGGYSLTNMRNPQKLRTLAYRGQIMVFSDSENELQKSLQILEPVIQKSGLEISDSSRVCSPTKDISKLSFTLENGTRLSHLKTDERWRCFGREFQGLEIVPAINVFQRDINKILAAPITNTQRMRLLIEHISQFISIDTFIDVCNDDMVEELRLAVRNAVLKIHKLPDKFSDFLMHTSVKDGGYGIPCIKCRILRMWEKILKDLRSSTKPLRRTVATSQWIKYQEKWLKSASRCKAAHRSI